MELPLEIWFIVFAHVKQNIWRDLRAHPCYEYNYELHDYVPGTEVENKYIGLARTCIAFRAEALRLCMEGRLIRLSRRIFNMSRGLGHDQYLILSDRGTAFSLYYNVMIDYGIIKIYGAKPAKFIFYNLYKKTTETDKTGPFVICLDNKAGPEQALAEVLSVSVDTPAKVQDELGERYFTCPGIIIGIKNFIEKNLFFKHGFVHDVK